MNKHKRKSTQYNKLKASAKTIEELEKSRIGGQQALIGYTYQQLYSAYLLLTELSENIFIKFEGIEDIDIYSSIENSREYIQVKYSSSEKNASFFDGILKNFLEVYLIDKDSKFTLVYDLIISDGNLKHLITNNHTVKSVRFWQNKINEIKTLHTNWNWNNFIFDDFFKSISYKNITRQNLEHLLCLKLIEKECLTVSNESLYLNALKEYCLECMQKRTNITKLDLDNLLLSVKDDISKGAINPSAYNFKRIDFDNILQTTENKEYFEGKKATYQDIVNKLPVRRCICEKEIENSIENNIVTVIKSSSGQGKTTLAWQVAYNLRKNYCIYQLLNCSEPSLVGNIVDFIKQRVQYGQKVLFILDNLNFQLKEWNFLVQQLQETVFCNYKIIITTREDDWYSFSGDISNVKSMNIVEISLDEQGAKDIFDSLSNNNCLDESIKNWYDPWTQVAQSKLLIEYVYLLTHGVMLSDRIDEQIKKINTLPCGGIICEMLRCICLADVCCIRLRVSKLIADLQNNYSGDITEILKMLNKEFLIKTEDSENYIIGLHPVRSHHILTRLHEFKDFRDTFLHCMKLIESDVIALFSSAIPKYISEEDDSFFYEMNKYLYSNKSYIYYIEVFKGLLSGTASYYFERNKKYFDDANKRYGLDLVIMDTNPFCKNVNLFRIFKDNKNMKELELLSNNIPRINKTYTHIYSKILFEYLDKEKECIDIESFIVIADYLFSINYKYRLINKIDVYELWKKRYDLSFHKIAKYFYLLANQYFDIYETFILQNKAEIFSFVKEQTKSVLLYEKKEDIHIEYLLNCVEDKTNNKESVERLKFVFLFLPNYKTYCANKIEIKYDFLKYYKIPNSSIKKIPNDTMRSMILPDLNTMWNKTIASKYECSGVYEWLSGWMETRKKIIEYFNICYKYICERLSCKTGNQYVNSIDQLGTTITDFVLMKHLYPHQDRPFELQIEDFDEFGKLQYFVFITNFIKFFTSFILNKKKLALCNIKSALYSFRSMESWFSTFVKKHNLFVLENEQIVEEEQNSINSLYQACDFYMNNDSSLYFSKFDIKRDFEKKENSILSSMKADLSDLVKNFFVVFPQNYIHNTYPLIIRNFDENKYDLLLFYIADVNTDFFSEIDIAFVDERNTIISGIRITQSLLLELKKIKENSEIGELINFPIFLSSESFTVGFCSCFETEYFVK